MQDGAVTHGRPLCPCHGEPMVRRNDRALGWRCGARHRAASIRWKRAHQEHATYYELRRKLRLRIERKRQRIAELEAQLAQEITE